MRKTLSANKRAWSAKIEILKKQVKDANEKFRKDHLNFVKSKVDTSDLLRKRNDSYE